MDRSAQAGLVVVGSHQHGVLRWAFLGSVSHTMLCHADCPVEVMSCRRTKTSWRCCGCASRPLGLRTGVPGSLVGVVRAVR
nr:universal stress protein [Kibdelosporangium sp. MJ126-NF4]